MISGENARFSWSIQCEKYSLFRTALPCLINNRLGGFGLEPDYLPR
jgi:hypothetical protein